nr:RecName: Full=Dermonecrotic toxin LgSicTox-LOXN6; AltName: Full=Phospholipase D; Short=PLD; AltName: Full=Sphingomyelin phosphodiesterase D; Short=SMD; Short=SMase D; Short=Sphingomyelinase D [Loxosceles gaucho]
DDKRRQI